MAQIVTAGVLRNHGTGWAPLIDSKHDAINIGTVTTTSTHILIHRPDVNLCYTFIATVDNNLADAGYLVGVSGGGENTHIYIYDASYTLVDPNTITTITVPYSNIWVYAVSGIDD